MHRPLGFSRPDRTAKPPDIDGSSDTMVASDDTRMLAEMESILRLKRISSWFQPIVNIKERRIIGYEALVRGPSGSPLHSPISLFDAALRQGRLMDLELLCREVHLRNFAKLRLSGLLFLNVCPLTLAEPNHSPGVTLRFLRQLGLGPDQVVIELTEQYPIDDYALMRTALGHYREMGFAVAIDDLGAGYAGLRLWSELRPDFVKFDRHFVQGIHEDSSKRHFVSSMQEIALGLDCQTIAEGIEVVEECRTLESLGIVFGQGYHFARPNSTPLRELPRRVFVTFNSGDNSTLRGRRSDTIGSLARRSQVVSPSVRMDVISDLFEHNSQLSSIPVVEQGRPVGIVRRADFMNLYATRFGRDLYGRSPVSEFMEQATLVFEKELPVEKVSQFITDCEDLSAADDFIVTDAGQYVGIGTILDLLRKITELQVRNARYANPLTLLPGSVPINETIDNFLREGVFFVVCYFDLDHFKPFNDHYGYASGDKIIRFLAQLLVEESRQECDFVGHIGGDDFMVVFQSHDWKKQCERVLERFSHEIPKFYNLTHQREGGISGEDRSGRSVFFPLMSLSVGAVIPNPDLGLTCHEIATMASEAKRHAKKTLGNSLFIERRKCLSDEMMKHQMPDVDPA